MIDRDIKEKFKKIYEVLPGLDDRRCGYRTCGEFAMAVAKGEAPCYGCITGGYKVAEKVCSIMGKSVPRREGAASGYGNNSAPSGLSPGRDMGRARGMGAGMGRGSRRGYRKRYYAAPGEEFRYHSAELSNSPTEGQYSYYSNMYNMPPRQNMDPGQEKNILMEKADLIKKQLDKIKDRISELEKDKKKGETKNAVGR
jgi:hypothetical protein